MATTTWALASFHRNFCIFEHCGVRADGLRVKWLRLRGVLDVLRRVFFFRPPILVRPQPIVEERLGCDDELRFAVLR